VTTKLIGILMFVAVSFAAQSDRSIISVNERASVDDGALWGAVVSGKASPYDYLLQSRGKDSVASHRAEAIGKIAPLEGPAGMMFIEVKPGQFTMGSSSPEIQQKWTISAPHLVRIERNFELGKHEVTRAQWEKVMGNPVPSDDQNPITDIRRDDIDNFLAVLNELKDGWVYRLPTEEEWEYSCRAGSTSEYFWGNSESTGSEFAWSDSRVHPVGQKRGNAWGLYDMIGNAVEFCQSWQGQPLRRQLRVYVDPAYQETARRVATQQAAATGAEVSIILSPGEMRMEASDPFNPGYRPTIYPLRGGGATCGYRSDVGSDLKDGTVGFRVARTRL
jgi:formylglycine-generating enzyme required for sulfatase activity